MKEPLFIGSATAIVAPLRQGKPDPDALSVLIERQARGGTAALVIHGTTGEAVTLSEPEKDALLEQAVRQTAGRMKIIVGIGGNDTEASLRAALRAVSVGADGLLMSTPYYNKTNPEGLRRHFLRVADEVERPLILYNVPGRTGMNCSPEFYASLADHPWINGIKEASGDMSQVSRTLRLCGDRLTIWSGNDDQTLPMMALGAKGVISVASNLIPGEIAALCRAALDGRWQTALALHRAYAELFELLFSDVNPIPVKAALHRMGLISGEIRLPLVPIAGEKRQRLFRCLEKTHLIE